MHEHGFDDATPDDYEEIMSHNTKKINLTKVEITYEQPYEAIAQSAMIHGEISLWDVNNNDVIDRLHTLQLAEERRQGIILNQHHATVAQRKEFIKKWAEHSPFIEL